MVILVYVDETLIISNDIEVKKMLKTMANIFSFTDLRKPTHFLGVKIDIRKDDIFLSLSTSSTKSLRWKT